MGDDFLLFLISSLALGAGFFSLGACTLLFLKYRTRMLKISLLFILSLLGINFGFWTMNLSGTAVLTGIVQFSGVALNIAVTPLLVSVLLSAPISRKLAAALLAWDALFIGASLAWALAPAARLPLAVANAQLVITIGASLAALLVNLKTIRPRPLQKAIGIFFAMSALFLPFLVLDLLVTRLGIRQLAAIDNLSLPVYFLALNVALFVFAVRFLGAEPFVAEGKITEACRAEYGLSPREAELVERMMDGLTNQELADALFISRKTVENHLYNIYQKLGVKNRIQLIQTFQNRKRES